MKDIIEITVKNTSPQTQSLNLFSGESENKALEISSEYEGSTYSDLKEYVATNPILVQSMKISSNYRLDNSRACLDLKRFSATGGYTSQKMFLMSMIDIYVFKQREIDIPLNFVLDIGTRICNNHVQPNEELKFFMNPSAIVKFNSAFNPVTSLKSLSEEGFDVTNLNPPVDRVKESEAADRISWFPIWIENKSSNTKRFFLPTEESEFELCEKNNEGFDIYFYDQKANFIQDICHVFEGQRVIDIRRIYSDNTSQFNKAPEFLCNGNRKTGISYFDRFSPKQLTPNIHDIADGVIRLKSIQNKSKKNDYSQRMELEILPKTNVCLFLKFTELKEVY